jgi:hypothetical protein
MRKNSNDHADHTSTAAEPGTNPRPARRPRGKSHDIARRFTWKAFKALAAVVDDQEAAPTARVAAANTLLEWGHGKRGESAEAPEVVEKTIKVDWGTE